MKELQLLRQENKELKNQLEIAATYQQMMDMFSNIPKECQHGRSTSGICTTCEDIERIYILEQENELLCEIVAAYDSVQNVFSKNPLSDRLRNAKKRLEEHREMWQE